MFLVNTLQVIELSLETADQLDTAAIHEMCPDEIKK